MIQFGMREQKDDAWANRSLRFGYHDGVSVAEEFLREIWPVRVEMLDLNRSPEKDWCYFSSFVQRDDTAVLAFDDIHGTVQGFFTISYIPVEHGGRKRLLLFSKYFYFRKAFRGHYKTVLAPWMLLPLSRTAGNVGSLKTDGLLDWEITALTYLAHTFYANDFDEEARLIRNQNVVDTAGLPQSEEGRTLANVLSRALRRLLPPSVRAQLVQ